MAKSETPSFILTLPLKTEPFQEHILIKWFEVCRQIYNSCLGELYKRYNAMKRDKAYQEAITLPKGDKTKSKRLSDLRSKYNIFEYAMHEYIIPMKNHYNAIDINTAQKIATRCYKAFKDVLFGKAKKAHFKKYGMMDSIEGKTNASGIRFKDNTVSFGKLKMPVAIKQKDIYAQECLTHRIKYCRIIKKLVNGKDRFYIQLILEVFFKMSKSYLKLAKEFQGRSYDSMVAHTAIVFIRYIMLAMESRSGEDPRTIGNLFYVCCDELADISLVEALQRIFSLMERFLGEQLQLAESEIRKLIDYLISNLPSFFKERLAVCCCES